MAGPVATKPESPPEVAASSQLSRFICLAVIGLGTLAYANSFNAPFQFDDFHYIAQSPQIILGQVAEVFAQAPNRILPMLSFMLNYQLHQGQVFGFHLVNFALHLLTSVMVYWLAFGILQVARCEDGATSAQRAQIKAGFVAMIYVSHPIQTEAVTYIWQRVAVMCALFYLAALYLFYRAITQRLAQLPRSMTTLGLALACAALALFSKQNAVTLPAMATLLWWHCLPQSPSWKQLQAWKAHLVPWFVLAALCVVPTLLLGTQELADIAAAQAQGTGLNRWSYLLTQLSVVQTYWRLLLLPLGQTLDYDYPITHSLGESAALIGAAVHLGVLYAAWRLRRKIPEAWLGVVFFYVTLSVESSVIPLEDVLFEHRLYLPSFGAFLALVGVLDRLAVWARARLKADRLTIWSPQRRIILTAALCLPLVVLTLARNRIWGSQLALAIDSVEKAPHKQRPHILLALTLEKAKSYAAAKLELAKALELGPPLIDTMLLEAEIYGALGDDARASGAIAQALALRPNNPTALLFEGVSLARRGQFPAARLRILQASKATPWDADLKLILARVTIDARDHAAGLAVYTDLIHMPAASGAVLHSCAEDLLASGDVALARNAIVAAQAAAGTPREQAEHLVLLTQIYLASGETAAAQRSWTELQATGLKLAPALTEQITRGLNAH